MGDLNLQYEIYLDNGWGVVSVRRVYSAKIDRRRSSVTVAMYQGDGAEEVCHIMLPNMCDNISQEWRRDIAKYMTVRQVLCNCHADV